MNLKALGIQFLNRLLIKLNLQVVKIPHDNRQDFFIDEKNNLYFPEGPIGKRRKNIVLKENWLSYFVLKQTQENQKLILKYEELSYSQYYQDLFVLTHLNFKSNGYFVEFGAANGQNLSNTYLLEHSFGWRGILAEPAKSYHPEIQKKRRATLEKKCVWKASGEQLEFIEYGVLSTISNFNSSDIHSRKKRKKYLVETITLCDMLREHKAPKIIDYLSIDTEGSELDILSAVDFSEYLFRVISVEHNFTENRERIFQLLTKNNYSRVWTDVSNCDDWYVIRQD